MLTEVISKLDRAVLELALIDAFSDMCFYEGDELIVDLESYLEDVDNKTNTEEQDNAFLEFAMPYIERSIMTYGANLFEGIDEFNIPAERGSSGSNVKVKTGTDVNTQTLESSKNLAKKVLKGNKLTEAEELAVWEGLYEAIIPSAKAGIAKAKTALVKTGKNLSNTVKGGILSAKTFAKNLSFKVSKGKSATASPEKK